MEAPVERTPPGTPRSRRPSAKAAAAERRACYDATATAATAQLLIAIPRVSVASAPRTIAVVTP